MLAEAENCMSTAPLMVPAARYGASGASAVIAARCALLMHAISGDRRSSRSRPRTGQGTRGGVALRKFSAIWTGGEEYEGEVVVVRRAWVMA